MFNLKLVLFLFCFFSFLNNSLKSQELNVRVDINHKKIEQTSSDIFDELKTNISEFINNRHWTNFQYKRNERIKCVFHVTINKYSSSEHLFNCTLNINCIRPVFNSSYSTTIFSFQDENFDFKYQQGDKLNFNMAQIDNELTSLLSYYSYFLIGMDGDCMSPLGGSSALKMAQMIATNSQQSESKGWKPISDKMNRYTLITSLLDARMELFRKMEYVYYREGLDIMYENPDRGRAALTKAIEELGKAYDSQSSSKIPILFTEYKADEIVNIFRTAGTPQEKNTIVDILAKINPSKNSMWNQIR